MRPRSRLALVAVGLVLGALPGAASGHAGLRATTPSAGAGAAAPPATVRLAFAAPVEGAFLRLEVVGPDGRSTAGPLVRDPEDPQVAAAVLRPAGPGTYRVAWRAFSGDGHPTRGTFAFSVAGGSAGSPVPVPTEEGAAGPLAVTARLLALVGVLGLLGLIGTRVAVVGAAWRAGGVWPPGPADRPGLRERARAPLERAAARWWACWWALAAAALAGLLLLPVAQLRGLGAGAGDLGTLLTATRWGRAWWVQVAAVAVAAAAAGLWARRGGREADPPVGWALVLGPPLIVAVVAASWAGHASSGADSGLGIGIDAVHGLATGLWLGGLLALAALIPPAAVALGAADRVRLGAAAVVRFSALAVAAVVVLVVTGTYRALAELGGLGDLWATAYGRALLVKLAIFAVMLVAGAYNRFVIHPRLERAALGLEASDRGALAALRRSVLVELALAAAVMVAVAVLVSLPPPP